MPSEASEYDIWGDAENPSRDIHVWREYSLCVSKVMIPLYSIEGYRSGVLPVTDYWTHEGSGGQDFSGVNVAGVKQSRGARLVQRRGLLAVGVRDTEEL